MTKILFICHGNICRSPMAEYIMKDLIMKAGLEHYFIIASAAISIEEIGKKIYMPARKKLEEHGIIVEEHCARRMEPQDYHEYDYLIAMEQDNIGKIMKVLGSDPDGKISLLLDYSKCSGDVEDPWYTGDFTTTYNQILEGCKGLLRYLQNKCKIVNNP